MPSQLAAQRFHCHPRTHGGRQQSACRAVRAVHSAFRVPRWAIAAVWLICAAHVAVPALNRWYTERYAVPYLRLTVALWSRAGGILRIQQDRAYRDSSACVRSLSPAGMRTVDGSTYYAVPTCVRAGG